MAPQKGPLELYRHFMFSRNMPRGTTSCLDFTRCVGGSSRLISLMYLVKCNIAYTITLQRIATHDPNCICIYVLHLTLILEPSRYLETQQGSQLLYRLD